MTNDSDPWWADLSEEELLAEDDHRDGPTVPDWRCSTCRAKNAGAQPDCCYCGRAWSPDDA